MRSAGDSMATAPVPTLDDAGYGYDIFGANLDWVRNAERAGRFFYERWFRVDSKGSENIPASGAAIIVANHSGTLPVDATMLWMDVLRRTNPPRLLRPIADHFVLNLPFIGSLATRTGAVGGTRPRCWKGRPPKRSGPCRSFSRAPERKERAGSREARAHHGSVDARRSRAVRRTRP